MTSQSLRLDGQIALITGAAHGLGRVLAHRLVTCGAHAICVSRDRAALESLADGLQSEGFSAVSLAVLDLCDTEAVSSLAERFGSRFGRLDIFVSNAAYQPPLCPVADLSVTDWQRAFAVNVFVAWHLMRVFAPLLLASCDARAVFMTCRESFALPYWGGLAASKAALERLVLSWALEHRRDCLKVNLFDPGALTTSSREACGGSMVSARSPDAVLPYLEPLLDRNLQWRGRLVKAFAKDD